MTLHGFIQAVAIPALLLWAASPAVTRAADTPADWLRGSGRELQVRLQGEVLDADGQPATEINISGSLTATGVKRAIDPKVNGHRFEIWIPANEASWYSMWLKAENTASDDVAFLTLNAYRFRQVAIDGVKLKLQSPTRRVEVKVSDGGRPVAGAHVRADLGYGIELEARSDASGVARFGLLPGQNLSRLTAWTDDHRIGGFSFNRKPTRDPDADQHVVEVSRCRDQRLRFVDENGKGVPNLNFVLHIATPPPDYNFIGAHEHAYMTTNAAGEVQYPWFPDWEKHFFYADLSTNRWVPVGEPEFVDGVAVFKVKTGTPRKQVAGRVTSQDAGVNLGGFYVTLESFQADREGHVDRITAISDANGAFAVDILPDATYCAFVVDERWVGEMIDLIPYQSSTQLVNAPELRIVKGEPVEVVVTTRSQKKPYPNLTVSFRREHSFDWVENGKSRGGIGGPHWWATTDEAGVARTRTLPGKLKASVYTPLWRTEQEADVTAGEPTTIQLHREIEDHRTVAGRLVLADGVESTLADADVSVGSVDGDYSFEQKLTAEDDGSFAVETVATAMGVFGQTKDGRAAGATVSKDLAKPIEVQLRATLEFRGQLLGEDGRPAPNRAIRAVIRVEGDENYGGLFVKSFEAKRIETSTDDDGAFRFEGVPAAIKVVLFADREDGSTDSHYLGDFFLEPGDERPPMVFRIKPEDQPAPVAPLAERYQKALRDAALNGYRVMAILASDRDHVAEFVDNNFVDYHKNKDIPSYMQLVVKPDKQDPGAVAAFLAERIWQLPDENRVVALALDPQGNELGRIELDVADPAAVQQAADFIHQHAPAQPDAEAKWKKAFVEAAASNRRVWARVSGRYCGPCFMLTRWLDDHRELLAKDYVMLKIEEGRDKNATEFAERLTRGKHYGIPFHVIFDEDEKLLIDSAGPLGNIGHPSSFEGKKHLRKMLLDTRQNLTDAEIDQLIESLED